MLHVVRISFSASGSVSAYPGPFSSPVALRARRDPSSRPQHQQHHVALHQGDECERGRAAESLRGADRLRSFVVGDRSERRLQENVTTADWDSAIHGTRVAQRNKSPPPVQARCRIPFLHNFAAWGSSQDRNSQGREGTSSSYAVFVGAPVLKVVRPTRLPHKYSVPSNGPFFRICRLSSCPQSSKTFVHG